VFLIRNVPFFLISITLLSTLSCFADDYDLLLFVPPTLSSCPSCKPRLVIVNNCDDNAIASFKVTGNDQWNFLNTQGGNILYSDYVHKAGDKFVQFPLGARGSATATKVIRIPDKGAASGNLSFYIDCKPNTDPSNPWNICKIGGNPGTDLLGAAFLFEPTFGCSQAITSSTPWLCQKNPSKPTEPLSTTDYFDISAVNAYQMPFKVEITSGTNCTKTYIDGSMLDLASCPGEDKTTMSLTTADDNSGTYAATKAQIAAGFSLLTSDVTGAAGTYNKACIAPGQWIVSAQLGIPVNPTPMTNSATTTANTADWYTSDNTCGEAFTSTACICPQCGGPQTYRGMFDNYTLSTPLTNYVTRLKEMGYIAGYTWAYDDYAGGMQCDQGEIITVTLCPAGGKPYAKDNRWWYNTNSSVNACVAVDSTTPPGTTEYTSLFECQKTAINRYALRYEKLVSQVPTAPYNQQPIYYCVTHPATGGGVTTYDYDTCKTNASACNAASLPGSGVPLPAYCPTS